jgi:hypothetical protein
MWHAFHSTAWYRTSFEQTIVKGKYKKYINMFTICMIVVPHNLLFDYLITLLNNNINCCDKQV